MKNMNKAMGSLLLFFLFFGCAVQPEQTLELSEEVNEVDQINVDIEDIDSMDEDFSLNELDELETSLDELEWE